MIVYTVHEPGLSSKNLEDRAEAIIFIKEGFSWLGFLLGPFWLLFHRLWLELLCLIAVLGIVFVGLSQITNQIDQVANILSLLVSLLIGFEGNNLRRWRLERKGYIFLTSVAGRNFEDCERRFFEAWLPQTLNSRNPSSSHVMDLKASPPIQPGWREPAVIGSLQNT